MLPFRVSDDDNFVSIELLGGLSGCCNGCDASNCVNTDPFSIQKKGFGLRKLYLLSPAITCGGVTVFLLGEYGKAVRVSETRFTGIDCFNNGVLPFVNIHVRGFKGESVTVMFDVQQTTKGQSIQHVQFTFPETGETIITCNWGCRVNETLGVH